MSEKHQPAQFSPQTVQPLPGTLLREFKRCGKARCHCAAGEQHVRYRRYWRENGTTRHEYVPRSDAPAVAAACARYKETRMSRRAMQRMLRDHDALLDQVLAAVTALRSGDLTGQERFIAFMEARR